ncbi:MAG: hypothetical protein CSB13_06615 [Chloroflexi bacterium]|nr:MAG: hypothetical protein CSB13_06615 [Chloroflexota bacterium]
MDSNLANIQAEIEIQRYDDGINDDSFQVWRNSGDIGYVHLAMKIVTEAMYDLVLGDYEDMLSAHYFFFGDRTCDPSSDKDSLICIWNQVLGRDEGDLPELVERYQEGFVDQADLERVRNLCTVVKTI